MAKLRKPTTPSQAFLRTEQTVKLASMAIQAQLGRVLAEATESGRERSHNLDSISDPQLRRSAAQK